MDKQPSIEAQIAALETQRAALVMRRACEQHLAGATEAEKDEGLLRAVGAQMEQRLAACRTAGKAGWHDAAQCSDEQLLARLHENYEARDWLDVAILAAMLHVRQLLQPTQEA